MKQKNTWSVFLNLIRPKHWSKNFIIFLGILLGIAWTRSFEQNLNTITMLNGLMVFFGSCLVSSANYILNDIFDLKWDMRHPIKKERRLSQIVFPRPFLILVMIILWVSGILVGFIFFWKIGLAIFLLMISGFIYNIPPVRAKDIAFFDVIIESFNNPLRFMMGWFLVVPHFFSTFLLADLLLLLLFYSCFVMTAKRFAEYLFLGRATAIKYRKVFRVYNSKRFKGAIFVYIVLSILTFIGIVQTANLWFHIVTMMLAIQMVWYYFMIFSHKHIVQKPVEIYRAKMFTAYSISIALTFIFLVFRVYL